MRTINEKYETISESDIDLSVGHIEYCLTIREDAAPVDNVKKFAWDDDDYEKVMLYRVDSVETEPTIQDEIDSVLVDQEYRLTLLELGIS